MKQTLAQKILQKHTDEEITADGQIVNCRLDLVLANDITGPLAIKGFKAMGATKVFDKDKVALVMDHFTPQKDIASANQVMISRRFAAEQNITHYYEGGNCGVEHTLLPEQGLVAPGDLVIGADSHTCTYGGISAFSTGMGSTDLAAGMALGETWFKVPPTIRVNITGTPDQYLRAKDLMLILIHRIGVDGARYKALEFGGSVIDNLSVEGRLTMANMAIEAGAKNGIFPVDERTEAYIESRYHGPKVVVTPDPDARYAREVTIDLSSMKPVVSFPHLPENAKEVGTFGEIKIDQVVIGSCTNGRLEDLAIAASIIKGHKIHPDVRCIVIPATPQIYKDAMHAGYIDTFIDAGCAVSTPTCGPCLGGYMGILASGEKCVSTTNRNFIGRMGPTDSEIYLAGPQTAAASAVLGRIAAPKEVK